MDAPKPSQADIILQDQIITSLPADPDAALWTLASLVESCTYSIGEPLSQFIERVIAYQQARP